jgi:hypothetical protein
MPEESSSIWRRVSHPCQQTKNQQMPSTHATTRVDCKQAAAILMIPLLPSSYTVSSAMTKLNCPDGIRHQISINTYLYVCMHSCITYLSTRLTTYVLHVGHLMKYFCKWYVTLYICTQKKIVYTPRKKKKLHLCYDTWDSSQVSYNMVCTICFKF